MSWWNSGAHPTSARVLRGPRVSFTRPASLLVDPAKLRLHRASRDVEEVESEFDDLQQFGQQEMDHVAPVDPEQQARDLEQLAYEIDTAKSAAFEEGYRNGVVDGRQSATAEFESTARLEQDRQSQDVASASAALLAAVERVEESRGEAAKVAEADCAELAFKLTRSLLGRELQLMENPAMESIHRALNLAPSNEAVLIRLNPADVAVLANFDMTQLGRECTIIADEAVEHGGSIVEVGPTTIDAQLGQALGRVRKALLGMGHPHSEHEPADSHPGGAMGTGPLNSASIADEAVTQLNQSPRSVPYLVGSQTR